MSDVTDDILEEGNKNLDKLEGIYIQPLPTTSKKRDQNWEKQQYDTNAQIYEQTDHELAKPQLQFPKELHECISGGLDNSYFPFIPQITEKSHKKSEIPEEIWTAREIYKTNHCKFHPMTQKPPSLEELELKTREKEINLNRVLPNPYYTEIMDVESRFCSIHISNKAQKYISLEDTPFTFVTTVLALTQLRDKLQITKCFAVDLEHHHLRSYQGILCLMQISTRDKDWVIDLLAPAIRPFIPQYLAHLFAHPLILKVFHGADSDVKWLQRDFGIYVVNMFDTGQVHTHTHIYIYILYIYIYIIYI